MATEQAPVTTDLLCPRCRAALEVSNNRLPENCPGCGLLLRARRQKAYNHNFVLVWKKALVWRGRAPRREFWGYAIIMGGIGLLLALLLEYDVSPASLYDVAVDWAKENHLPQPRPQQVADVG